MNKVILLLVGIVWSVVFIAQDPVFNQIDNSRNYLNPAYIGTEKSFSADLNYRNQWPELSGNYKTLAFQVNQYLGKGNGVSIHFVNDNASNTVMKSEIGLGYAKVFSFPGHHNVSIGAQASYFNKTLDVSKLTFGNQINPQQGFVYPTAQSIDTDVSGVDFNTGLLYYNNFIFLGYSAKHITQPNESFYGGVSKLPMRHSMEIGGKIKWNEVAFVPSVRYFNQGSFSTVFSMLKVKWKSLEIDGGVQFNNGLFVGAGFSSEKFNIGYNYTSSLNNISSEASTHEIRMGCDLMLFKKENEYFFDF